MSFYVYIVLISLAVCLFVSVIPSCTYIAYITGTKVELHVFMLFLYLCLFYVVDLPNPLFNLVKTVISLM